MAFSKLKLRYKRATSSSLVRTHPPETPPKIAIRFGEEEAMMNSVAKQNTKWAVSDMLSKLTALFLSYIIPELCFLIEG